jgi:hypothetical protein
MVTDIDECRWPFFLGKVIEELEKWPKHDPVTRQEAVWLVDFARDFPDYVRSKFIVRLFDLCEPPALYKLGRCMFKLPPGLKDTPV